MTIEITRLKPNSPELHTCAEWRYEAFLKSYGYSLLDSGAQLTKLATQPDEYETAVIALVDGHLAGICLLVLREFEPLHDVSPGWQASMLRPNIESAAWRENLLQPLRIRRASIAWPGFISIRAMRKSSI